MKRQIEYAKKAKGITVLVLGSSHMAAGYIPINGELNLAIHDCDLYYCLEIYRIFNTEKIKNIVISYSVFSRGHSLIQTHSCTLCSVLKILLGIDYQDKNMAKRKHLYFIEKLHRFFSFKPKNNIKHIKMHETDAKTIGMRAKKHYKNFKRKISQHPYLTAIFESAKINGQKVFVVIPPVTSSYRNAIPNEKTIFQSLYNEARLFSNVEILNYYNSPIFNDGDFTDGDHLNRAGADKLSKAIRENFI